MVYCPGLSNKQSYKYMRICMTWLRLQKSIMVKRKLKQWWATILPISTIQIIILHLKHKKGIPAYCVGYTDPGLGQAENCGEVKLFNWTLTLPAHDSWVPNDITCTYIQTIKIPNRFYPTQNDHKLKRWHLN
jgi:hypothetical protein